MEASRGLPAGTIQSVTKSLETQEPPRVARQVARTIRNPEKSSSSSSPSLTVFDKLLSKDNPVY